MSTSRKVAKLPELEFLEWEIVRVQMGHEGENFLNLIFKSAVLCIVGGVGYTITQEGGEYAQGMSR